MTSGTHYEVFFTGDLPLDIYTIILRGKTPMYMVAFSKINYIWYRLSGRLKKDKDINIKALHIAMCRKCFDFVSNKYCVTLKHDYNIATQHFS